MIPPPELDILFILQDVAISIEAVAIRNPKICGRALVLNAKMGWWMLFGEDLHLQAIYTRYRVFG